MNHLKIWQNEVVSTSWDQRYAEYLANIADATGLTADYGDGSLDGDRSADNPNPDPACLDELYDWFCSDVPVSEAAEIIEIRKNDAIWRN